MPALPLYDFSGGVDRRNERSMLPTNALWMARNLWVDNGNRLRRRVGMVSDINAMSLCDGWVFYNGQMRTFAIKGTAYNSQGYPVIELDTFGGGGAGNNVIRQILFAEVFGQFVYAICQYGDGTIRHHYVDGSGDTRVTDVNCPHSASATIVNNRVFAITAVGTVRFCAAGLPRDWTAANNAGFLPVSNNQDGVGNPTGVGQFQSDLAVFFENAVQVWFPDIDPAKMFVRQRIYGTGTMAPRTIVPFANDLGYVSGFGIRSVSVATQTTNREETDIGSAIDDAPIGVVDLNTGFGWQQYLAFAAWDNTAQSIGYEEPFARYFPVLGQVWFVFQRVAPLDTANASGVFAPSSVAAGKSVVAVLTFSKTGRKSAWSFFHFPWEIYELKLNPRTRQVFGLTASGSLSGPRNPRVLRLNAPGTGFENESDSVAIGGNAVVTPIDWYAELPFLDNGLPGIMKQFYGMDAVASRPGTTFSFRYDSNDETRITVPQVMDAADTRPGGMVPVEMATTAIAPVVSGTTSGDFGLKEWTVSGMQLYYEELGPS
jgi:hypothetical protein